MRSLLLAAFLLLSLDARADETPPASETQAATPSIAAPSVPSDAPAPNDGPPDEPSADAPAGLPTPTGTDAPPASAPADAHSQNQTDRAASASSPTTPERPPAPSNDWSLQGFLHGGTVVLSQSPSQGFWRIRTGISEIVLVPASREASIAGHPMPWPDLPLAPSDPTALQPGPEMPERGCRFWIETTLAGGRAWCWDSQGRPLRIMTITTRTDDQWRLVFDATTPDTAALWQFLRAVGR
jgi:hypothetical protein